jgi:hypothetical protein
MLAGTDSHTTGAQKDHSGDKRREKSCVEAHASNDEVERRGVALATNEADLSRSSTPPWLTEDIPRDCSNRLLDSVSEPFANALPFAFANRGR